MATSVKNRAGIVFMRAMKRIDHIHKKIDRRACNGKYNEDTTKFKLAKNGARIWSF